MNTLELLSKEFNFGYTDIPVNMMDGIKLNGAKFLHGILESFHSLTEDETYDIDYEFDSGSKGGIIVFSTDVNSIFGKNPSLKNRIKAIYLSVKARIQKNKRLSSVLFSHEEVTAVSIGNYFKGRYSSANGTYDENSTSVEIIGISFELICTIAAEIAKEFQQETVLVKDNESRRIVLVKTKEAGNGV